VYVDIHGYPGGGVKQVWGEVNKLFSSFIRQYLVQGGATWWWSGLQWSVVTSQL